MWVSRERFSVLETSSKVCPSSIWTFCRSWLKLGNHVGIWALTGEGGKGVEEFWFVRMIGLGKRIRLRAANHLVVSDLIIPGDASWETKRPTSYTG